jgi:hypothetical protein
MFAVNVENYDPYKLTVTDLHSSTIRCPLNINGLLHKLNVKALTVR